MHIPKKLSQNSPDWLTPLWSLFQEGAKQGHLITEQGAFAVFPREKSIFCESAWMHILLPGASKKLIDTIEMDLGFRMNDPSIDVLALGLPYVTGGYDFDHYVPDEIKTLLLFANGYSLFGGHLCIWGIQTMSAGLREEYYSNINMRDGEMTNYNIWSRPKGLKPKILVFGVYPSNGSILYMRDGDAAVYNSDRSGAELYINWPSFGVWLRMEIERLSLLFDEVGKLNVPFSETHP